MSVCCIEKTIHFINVSLDDLPTRHRAASDSEADSGWSAPTFQHCQRLLNSSGCVSHTFLCQLLPLLRLFHHVDRASCPIDVTGLGASPLFNCCSVTKISHQSLFYCCSHWDFLLNIARAESWFLRLTAGLSRRSLLKRSILQIRRHIHPTEIILPRLGTLHHRFRQITPRAAVWPGALRPPLELRRRQVGA